MSSYKQENREGRIAVIHPHTGAVLGRFVAKHFADDFMARLPEPEEPKPKRARGPKGRMKADDPSTPDVNEAYEGGKAPKKKPAKKPAKKKAKKKASKK